MDYSHLHKLAASAFAAALLMGLCACKWDGSSVPASTNASVVTSGASESSSVSSEASAFSAISSTAASEWISSESDLPDFILLSSVGTQFMNIIDNNSIDKAYLNDEKLPKYSETTVGIAAFYEKYIRIWQNEMDTVLKKLRVRLSGKTLQELNDSQIGWEKYLGNFITLGKDIYDQTVRKRGTWY